MLLGLITSVEPFFIALWTYELWKPESSGMQHVKLKTSDGVEEVRLPSLPLPNY